MKRSVLVGMLLAVMAAAAEPPNFIVILSDDQSWVGSSLTIDPERPETRSDYFVTPQIERLAARGMRFTDGYAPAPFCCPTRRSIQVGQTPARHLYQKDQEGWPAAYRQRLNIPKVLKAANPDYRTAHFGKWDHRFDQVSPQEMGYDASDGVTGNGAGGSKGTGGPAARQDPKLIFGITDRASAFMEEQVKAGRPFYLQVSHYAVHLDIFYREQTLDSLLARKRGTKHNMPEFAAMTEDMDIGIGLLLDKVEELGLWGNTYVFFLSDNGGRNSIPGAAKAKAPRNSPLRDGKGSMYEGGIRVPFVVAGPGVAKGSLSRVPVTGLDILPTIAELAGYPKELPASVDGGSMRAVLEGNGRGEVRRQKPFLIFHHAVGRKAQTGLRLGKWKMVKTWKPGTVELFDLSADLGESRDLALARPEKARELERLLDSFLEEVGAETRGR